MTPPRQDIAPRPPPPAWRRVALAIAGLYLLAAIPLILLMGPRGRPGEDQINYHEPTIHAFAQQLPHPYLKDYRSATTPGYHLVLAFVDRFISADARVLQLAGACFTLLLLVLLARAVSTRSDRPWRECLVLCLPFLCSTYVLQSGVWLLPDNAGWLLVLCCLALALREPLDRRAVVLAGIALALLVLVRQVHLWAAGTLWAAAWLAPGIDPPGRVAQLLTRIPSRVRSLTPSLVAALPAFLLLGAFMKLWGGLTPPSFQVQYSFIDFASYAFVLSLLGVGSLFFLGYLADPLAELKLATNRRGVALGALAGAIVAIIPATTYSVPGRFSGLWNAVKHTPTIAGHTSVLVVALSTLGGAMLVLWSRVLTPRPRWILLGAWFGFATSQVFAAQLWERYNEPMVLLMLALMAAASRPTATARALTHRLLAPLRLAGVGALALLLSLLSAYTISQFRPASLYDINLLNHPTAPAAPPTTP